MPERDAEEEIDLRGLLCPLPVLKARKRLDSMGPGQVLRVVATDPMTAIDMAHFCNEQGHALLSQDKRDAVFIFRIRRK
jgi:tRNA 2-thiouridine synthesizing protein A